MKRSCSLLSCSQTSLPKDERDAVNPGKDVRSIYEVPEVYAILVKVLMFLIEALNLILTAMSRNNSFCLRQLLIGGYTSNDKP